MTSERLWASEFHLNCSEGVNGPNQQRSTEDRFHQTKKKKGNMKMKKKNDPVSCYKKLSWNYETLSQNSNSVSQTNNRLWDVVIIWVSHYFDAKFYESFSFWDTNSFF